MIFRVLGAESNCAMRWLFLLLDANPANPPPFVGINAEFDIESVLPNPTGSLARALRLRITTEFRPREVLPDIFGLRGGRADALCRVPSAIFGHLCCAAHWLRDVGNQ